MSEMNSEIQEIESDEGEHKLTALVTGGNRGIGLEICRQLAKQGINVLLGAKELDKAEKAAALLNQENAAESDCGLVSPWQLDVTSEQDRQYLHQQLEQEQLTIDILVNNAGISKGIRYSILNEPTELTKETLEINFWGSLYLCQIVIPFMQQNGYGRVVNVSSGHGSFGKIDQRNVGYRFSKVSMNAMTVMLADAVSEDNVLVNTMTPGWVRTRLGGMNANRGVEEGADTAVWLCLLDDDGPRGGFFKDRQPFPW